MDAMAAGAAKLGAVRRDAAEIPRLDWRAADAKAIASGGERRRDGLDDGRILVVVLGDQGDAAVAAMVLTHDRYSSSLCSPRSAGRTRSFDGAPTSTLLDLPRLGLDKRVLPLISRRSPFPLSVLPRRRSGRRLGETENRRHWRRRLRQWRHATFFMITVTGFAWEARKPSIRSTISARMVAGIAANHSTSGMPATNVVRCASVAAFQSADFKGEAAARRLRVVVPVLINRRAPRMLNS